VPNFQGLTRTQAIQEARNAGFAAPQFALQESSESAGTVIAQNPPAGGTVDGDTIISLTLATAASPSPSPSPTPDLRTEPETTESETTEPQNDGGAVSFAD
jgi:beta-lactam-binding protein with PASTA domain